LGIFQDTVTGAEEYYENVGEYKRERCELNAFAAQWMASGSCKLEAIQYFQDALSEEFMWEYKEWHCRKLVEEATGSTMPIDDLFKIETMEEGDKFIWKCLLARNYGEESHRSIFFYTSELRETRDERKALAMFLLLAGLLLQQRMPKTRLEGSQTRMQEVIIWSLS
jgi:hypothetical protein